jgi:hypothetical protein
VSPGSKSGAVKRKRAAVRADGGIRDDRPVEPCRPGHVPERLGERVHQGDRGERADRAGVRDGELEADAVARCCDRAVRELHDSQVGSDDGRDDGVCWRAA